MPIKKRKKIYLSFSVELLDYVNKKAKELNVTRTRFVNGIIENEYKKNRKELIQQIIEG